MELQLLGSLTVLQNGRQHHLASKRVRTVLALLALSPGQPVGFDHLVDQLWAERRMENSRNALQANIGRLRKFLETVTGDRGDQLVRTLHGGYVLNLPPEAVDAHSFLSLAERGAAAAARRPEEAVRLLEQALRLWRGPALFDLYEGSRLQLEATHLDEQRLSAREDLIAAKLTLGEVHGIISELRQLTTEHPGRERFSEQLMLALYRNGRQTEALDVFHRTRQWLVSELGLEPGRGLAEVYRSILSQDVLVPERRALGV
jgi:DNA-binding SARP family transcriptional activator